MVDQITGSCRSSNTAANETGDFGGEVVQIEIGSQIYVPEPMRLSNETSHTPESDIRGAGAIAKPILQPKVAVEKSFTSSAKNTPDGANIYKLRGFAPGGGVLNFRRQNAIRKFQKSQSVIKSKNTAALQLPPHLQTPQNRFKNVYDSLQKLTQLN